MFSCLPYWMRQPSLQAHDKRNSSCVATSTDNDEAEVNDIVYSDVEEILQDKKQMLEAEKKERKIKNQKLKKRKETCKRYKKKAREIEKQFETMEREKIERKREALRKTHKKERLKLLRQRQLLIEKEELERWELKNREKNIKKHMKNLKKQMRAKCKSIYYEESSEELSDSCNLDRIPIDQQKCSSNRSHSRLGQNQDNTRIKIIRELGPSKSDEAVGRLLNTLLSTDINFDSDVITRIKILLKSKPKLQGFFDEYSRKNNNLTNNLKYKLFNRIGLDSKLKLFFNSKKKMNMEQRELLRCILEQVTREYGYDEHNKNGGDCGDTTALHKIYNILWRKPGVNSSSKPQNHRVTEVGEQLYPGTSTQDTKGHRGENEYKKKTAKIDINDCRKCIYSIDSVELTKNKNRSSNETNCTQHGYRKSRSRGRKVKKCKGHWAKKSPKFHTLPESRLFLDKARVNTVLNRRPEPYSDESDLELKPTEQETRETTQPTAAATKPPAHMFNLLRYFKGTRIRRNSTDAEDKKTPAEKRKDYDIPKVCQIKCARCQKATESDVDSENLTDWNEDFDENSKNSSEHTDQEKEDKSGGRFWNLFNKRDNYRGGQSSKRPSTARGNNRKRTVWTDK